MAKGKKSGGAAKSSKARTRAGSKASINMITPALYGETGNDETYGRNTNTYTEQVRKSYFLCIFVLFLFFQIFMYFKLFPISPYKAGGNHVKASSKTRAVPVKKAAPMTPQAAKDMATLKKNAELLKMDILMTFHWAL